MFRQQHVSLYLLALALVLVLSGCQAVAAEGETGAIPQVTFVTRDYAFEGPQEIASGWVEVRIENEGPDFHHVQLVKLADGKTAADLAAEMGASHTPPAWASMVGGPNAIGAGQSASALLQLEPGAYALICTVPDREGVSHLAHGMVRELTVTDAASVAAEPAADVEMDLVDFSFVLSAPLKAGEQTIRVNNRGEQPHEVWLAKLAPGKTPNDLLMSLAPGAPPEAWDSEAIGGVAWIDAGSHNYFTADLEPGRYALLCFVPDAESGQPHFMLGMVQEITVK